MKWNFNDPTAEKWDQVPLTSEERKLLKKFGLKLIALFIIVETAILLLL